MIMFMTMTLDPQDSFLSGSKGLLGLQDMLLIGGDGNEGDSDNRFIMNQDGDSMDGITSSQCIEILEDIVEEMNDTSLPVPSNPTPSKKQASSPTASNAANTSTPPITTSASISDYYATASPRRKEIRANYKSNIHKIVDHFDLPIHYAHGREKLDLKMVKDLELVESQDGDNKLGIYERLMNPQSQFGKTIVQQFAKFYSTDESFLQQNQELLSKFNPQDAFQVPIRDCMIQLWDDIKNDTDFNYTYSYLDWEMFNFLNQNEWFLLFMTWYNLSAPIMSLLGPVMLLILPVIVILLGNSPLNGENYVRVLMEMMEDNAVGRLMTSSFRNSSPQEKLSMLMSATFYCFSIYQNFVMCQKFYKNMKLIHTNIGVILEYVQASISDMQKFLQISGSLSRYEDFNKDVRWNLDKLQKMEADLVRISPYMFSYQKVMEMGYVLRCFYNIYNDADLNDAMLFSFGFSGFYECMQGLANRVHAGKMSPVEFVRPGMDDKGSEEDEEEEGEKEEKDTPKTKKALTKVSTKLTSAYYPGIIDKPDIVVNDITLDRNMIITGPNASGKTTVLKSTLVNILLCQQLGVGCFTEATLIPYNHFHCYLNIPDTSGRDSLFQSESRQCSEILKSIKTNKSRHFCAFDELYSGTNPEEAELCGYAFLLYLTKQKARVDFVLTTHYGNMCRRLDKQKSIANMRMKIENREESHSAVDLDDAEEDLDIHNNYTYKLEEGINDKNGGIVILQQMEYPKEVLETLASNKGKQNHEEDAESIL